MATLRELVRDDAAARGLYEARFEALAALEVHAAAAPRAPYPGLMPWRVALPYEPPWPPP